MKTECCEKYDTCTTDCIQRLHWYNSTLSRLLGDAMKRVRELESLERDAKRYRECAHEWAGGGEQPAKWQCRCGGTVVYRSYDDYCWE